MPFPDGSGAEADPNSAVVARNEALRSGANPGQGALGGAAGFPPGLAPQAPDASGLPAHLLNPSQFVPSPEAREPGAPLSLGGPSDEGFVTPTVTPATTQPPVPPMPTPGTVKPNGLSGQPPEALAVSQQPVRKAVIFNTQGLNLATGTEDKPEGDGLVWKVACKTGTLALSPGPGQVDSERPLVLDDQLFSDMLLSFQEKAFPYITVPETHANGSLENTGYVKAAEVLTRDQLLADTRFSGMKEDTKQIIQADPESTKYLLAGIEFTDPKAKEKALNGSIPDTSIGVKFGYRNKRTGKLYTAAWEHLALTPMPWVDGLVPFGLSQDGAKIVDADEALEPFDGCYMPMDELNAAMRIRVRGATSIDPATIAAQIGQLSPGDEWSFDYGVSVQALQAPASDQAQGDGSTYYLLDTGYDPDSDQRRPPALHTTAESAAGAAFAAIQAQEARRLAREVARQMDRAVPAGYSQEGTEGDGIDLAVFRPQDHPRDPLGRFKSVLEGLKDGERVDLPDGTTVAKRKGAAGFVVSGHTGAMQGPSGKHKAVNVGSADEAAKTALTRSAGLNNPNSLGGSTSHKSIEDATKGGSQSGARTAESFKPDQVVSVSGVGLAKVVGPAPNGKVKVKRQVEAPGGKTKTIESVHTPFELEPFNGPTQGAGGVRGLSVDDQELEGVLLSAEGAQDGTGAGTADLSTSGDPTTLPSDTELHASQETSNNMTVEEILAQQQAEAEAQAARIAELEAQLSLSQGTIQSQGEQIHAENVAKRVKQLQEDGLAPAVLVRAQEIYLADKPGLDAEDGLNLSVASTDDQGQATTREFKRPSDIVDYLLSAMPTTPTDTAARLARIHEHVDELHASAHVGANSEEAKRAEVEAHERKRHPERFADNGKGPRL